VEVGVSPDDIDTLIFTALADGQCVLSELARRCNHDASQLMRRLHVLNGQKKVGTQLEDGRVYWFSKEAAPKTTTPAFTAPAATESATSRINRAAVVRRKPREQPAKAPAPEPNPEPTPEAMPMRVHATRTKRQPIIVRERQRVFELRVAPVNDGDVIIQAENDIEGADPDAVFVPAADIPALIRALTDVMAQ
jgi:hypothetical protein